MNQRYALGRVSQRGSSTPTRRVETKKSKKRDSSAQLFAQLAEQFVDQVKSFARINEPSEDEEEKNDDDDIILIDPKTSEPIRKSGNGGLKVAERRVRIRGIPIRAASRVAEVLKNEFGITIFETKKLDGAAQDRKNSPLNDQPKSTAFKASFLPSTASNVARENSSDDIEIDNTPYTNTIPSSLLENGSEDRSDRIADENTANTSKGLAITQMESTPAESPSSTTPAIDPAPTPDQRSLLTVTSIVSVKSKRRSEKEGNEHEPPLQQRRR